MPELKRAPVFIDSDMGCDDALAVAWLHNQPGVQIVGASSVFGNSSVENTTANLITLLAALESDAPVTLGAAAPLVYAPTSSGALVHGPDGMWGAQQPQDLRTIARNAPAAIIAAAQAHPDLTIIALGPLTNLALAVQQNPAALAGRRLVALGGGRVGNITPVAEFNIFADPHALDVVLGSDMRIDLVTLDAFEQVLVDSGELSAGLADSGAPAGSLLAQALTGYAMATTRGAGGNITIPDAAAVIYALRPDLGTPQPATVRTVLDGELTRGQTIIATTFNHQIALGLGSSGIAHLVEQLATPGFSLDAAIGAALASAPHNARVIMQVDGAAMSRLLIEGLLGRERAVGVR